MKSALSVNHLIRHFLLFALTILLMLTVVRAGLNLWQLHKVQTVPTLVASFVTGFRFDLALIGYILVVPIIVVTTLSLFSWTRGFARIFSLCWLTFWLLLILVLEVVTPYFLLENMARPDWYLLSDIKDPVAVVAQLGSPPYLIPTVIGICLLVLILIAFWARLETNRFLRFPVVKWSGVLFLLIGVSLCVLAARSSVDFQSPGLGLDAALISEETIVNEITLNSSYKLLMSLFGELQPMSFIDQWVRDIAFSEKD